MATFTAIGALKCGKLGFYNQSNHKYSELLLSEPQEIGSCIGNVAIKGEEIFVHAHSVLSNNKGKTTAGHLLEGRVFAAEVHLVELLCENVLRTHDQETGLYLWDFIGLERSRTLSKHT